MIVSAVGVRVVNENARNESGSAQSGAVASVGVARDTIDRDARPLPPTACTGQDGGIISTPGGNVRSRFRRSWSAITAMLAGLSTSVPALFLLVLAPLLLVLVPFVPDALRPVRALADRERARLSTSGEPVPRPYHPRPEGHLAAARSVLADPATWRDLCWLAAHGVGWTLTALVVVALWPAVAASLAMPLFWSRFPPGTFTALLILVETWWQALTLPFLQAAAYAVIALWGAPLICAGWHRVTRALLRPTAHVSLTDEVERLAETRTGALESHGAELRRIERDLHDGVQAHLVAISVRLGLADRALAADPTRVQPLIRDARDGIEDVLGDLRGIIRGIYPPILTDRGLAGAISALAAGRDFPVAVRIADELPRLPAPVEAAAYFIVAEALTNASRHSSAGQAAVIITEECDELAIMISDDGCGGADPGLGSGLAGIGRRVAALDGRFTVQSPVGGETRIEARLPCGS